MLWAHLRGARIARNLCLGVGLCKVFAHMDFAAEIPGFSALAPDQYTLSCQSDHNIRRPACNATPPRFWLNPRPARGTVQSNQIKPKDECRR